MDTGGNTASDPFPRVPQKLTGKGSLAFRDRTFSALKPHILKLAADPTVAAKIPAVQPTAVVRNSCR
jgi:hypothetical protein